jgi:hypothetical protein
VTPAVTWPELDSHQTYADLTRLSGDSDVASLKRYWGVTADIEVKAQAAGPRQVLMLALALLVCEWESTSAATPGGDPWPEIDATSTPSSAGITSPPMSNASSSPSPRRTPSRPKEAEPSVEADDTAEPTED